eukprot:751286-Hanusia_phi.AAC.1
MATFALHGARRVVAPSSSFMSDQAMEKLLKQKLEALCAKDVIQGQVDQHLAHEKAILLKGGYQISQQHLGAMLGFAGPSLQGEGGAEASETIHDVPVVANAAMRDVMERYGEDVAELRERRNMELKEIVGMENMR